MSGSADAPSERSDQGDLRPGPLAWIVIALGWTVMGVAVVGAFGALRSDGISSWGTWVVGSAVIHDFVLLPAVICLGWLLTRWVPVPWRVPVRTALVVSGIVTLTVYPIARRWGARDDNPSILPLPVGRNLAVLVAVLVTVAIGVGAVSALRSRTPEDPPPEGPS